MNIFVTDTNPYVCAKHHCDVHLRKMIVETAQLLSTTHYIINGYTPAYKPTHKNHPCAVWIRESSNNYKWTYELLTSLINEFEYRFDKQHATKMHLSSLKTIPKLPNIERTEFVLVMPDEFKTDNVTHSYQIYLNNKFKEWASRSNRPIYATYTKTPKPYFIS